MNTNQEDYDIQITGSTTQIPYNINSSGNVIWIGNQPSTTSAPANGIWHTYPSTSIQAGGLGVGYNQSNKYTTFKLPKKKIPEAVYVSGRMVTIGILGADVECAFVGNALIFSPNVLQQTHGGRITLILQYANVVYHYKINHSFGQIELEEGSNTICSQLLSTIKREKCSSRAT